MWRSGGSRQRRKLAVQHVLAAAGEGRDPAPWRRWPQVWEHFEDEADLLQALHREWRTALAGAVYCAIAAGDGDLHQDVAAAWRSAHRRHPHLRRILEAYRDHPSIAAAMRKESRLLSHFLSLDDGRSSSVPGPSRAA